MQAPQPTRFIRQTAALACAAALALATAGAADARPVLTERDDGLAPQQPQVVVDPPSERGDGLAPQQPQVVVDPPSDRAAAAKSAPPATTTQQASDDSDGDGAVLVGVSLLTVALLGSGTYIVRRRRHVARA